MAGKITIQTIAENCGVCIATVSRVLNGRFLRQRKRPSEGAGLYRGHRVEEQPDPESDVSRGGADCPGVHRKSDVGE